MFYAYHAHMLRYRAIDQLEAAWKRKTLKMECKRQIAYNRGVYNYER